MMTAKPRRTQNSSNKLRKVERTMAEESKINIFSSFSATNLSPCLAKTKASCWTDFLKRMNKPRICLHVRETAFKLRFCCECFTHKLYLIPVPDIIKIHFDVRRLHSSCNLLQLTSGG